MSGRTAWPGLVIGVLLLCCAELSGAQQVYVEDGSMGRETLPRSAGVQLSFLGVFEGGKLAHFLGVDVNYRTYIDGDSATVEYGLYSSKEDRFMRRGANLHLVAPSGMEITATGTIVFDATQDTTRFDGIVLAKGKGYVTGWLLASDTRLTKRPWSAYRGVPSASTFGDDTPVDRSKNYAVFSIRPDYRLGIVKE